MNDELTAEFGRHVREGLTARPRWLSSRYIYDAEGSRLFEGIMNLPEYYLTRAEYAILEQSSREVEAHLPAEWAGFDVVEFGAGDGTKTRLLLQELQKGRSFRYIPVDISAAALQTLQTNLCNWLPGLDVVPLQAEYFAALDSLRESGRPRLVLFLGSNIGNFTPEQTHSFLSQLKQRLSPGDCVLVGFDLKKHPQRILAAYNDSQGLTRDFNRNLLHRINRELGGNFKPEQFDFYPSYVPESGEMHAFLVSTRDQHVFITALDLDLHFKAWDAIHTEVSRKYDLAGIAQMAAASGFAIRRHFIESHGDFVDTLWRVE